LVPVVKPGSVPTTRIATILGTLIKDRWPYSSEDLFSVGDLAGGYAILASKVGCDPTTIERIVEQKNEGADFDLVDKLFCALGRPDVWRGELLDVYEGMCLLERCAHPGCSVQFVPPSHGGRRKRYCSQSCADSARRGLRRIKHFRGRAQREHSAKCRNGHPRTPESTIRLKSGRIRCRVCNNATSNRLYHAKRRAALAVTA
jgi:hypothetical protein